LIFGEESRIGRRVVERAAVLERVGRFCASSTRSVPGLAARRR